jgi:seryl-tRNA synthetase
MVLDIELFRADKGGDPEKVRQSQKNRFKDTTLVDRVVDSDTRWRKLRFQLDQLNKLKNDCSRVVAEKKKNKEPEGDDESLPDTVTNNLASLTVDTLKSLSITQLRKLSSLTNNSIESCKEEISKCEAERKEALSEIGNLLHDSVFVSNNEEDNEVVRMFGDTETRKKYSHIDLIQMIDGFDGDRGSATAGGRGYYLKGAVVFLNKR